jgi:hypothetical protein
MTITIRMTRGVLVATLAALLLSAGPAEERPAPPFEPTDAYEEKTIEGWRVLVNKKFARDEPALCDETLALLRHQLYQIPRMVPKEAAAKLRKVTVWVEEKEGHHPCMAYHPDAGWLRGHDMNPDKAKCVEVANARNFLTWTRQQPWMVLHELAHAYHHQFMPEGFDNGDTRDALRNAKEQKLYDSVLHINGRTQQAYALTNPQEYFAECSEAYFGTNDFFPFVRSELKKHDPAGFELMQKAWE